MSTPESVRKSRAQLLLLVAVFFVPLAIAFALYYGAWRPAGSTNHGELLDPPRPLPSAPLTSVSGAPFDAGLSSGKWSLVYVGDGACDPRCREALTLMRQTRLALNDDLSRVQRVFLAAGACCDSGYLDAEHAGLIVARTDSAAGEAMLKEFPDVRGGRIYIVDPLGNLMMSYAPDAPPKGLLEDLKKLLKLSRIG